MTFLRHYDVTSLKPLPLKNPAYATVSVTDRFFLVMNEIFQASSVLHLRVGVMFKVFNSFLLNVVFISFKMWVFISFKIFNGGGG